jgi:16S rRNA (guanine1516-N2)-methyltransferase
LARAQELSRRLGLPSLVAPPERGIYLAVDDDGLSLRDADTPGAPPLAASLTGNEIDRRLRGGRRSALARAIGLHRRPEQSVFDATCGLGRDAAVLLGLGCEVRAAERHPVMRVLLEDAVRRAERDYPARMRGWRGLVNGDAAEWLAAQTAPVADVVYLDPMFGEGGRRALPKRAMQILSSIVGGDADADALFAAARAKAGRRLVIKRHGRAPALAPPDMRITARGARFDIYTAG